MQAEQTHAHHSGPTSCAIAPELLQQDSRSWHTSCGLPLKQAVMALRWTEKFWEFMLVAALVSDA